MDANMMLLITATVFVLLLLLLVIRRRSKGNANGVEEAVLSSADLPKNSMKEVAVRTNDAKSKSKKKVLLVRTKTGDLHALGSKCPHVGAPLAKGVLCGNHVTCPWHAACFDVTTGDIEDGPALNKLAKYPVREANGQVYVTTPLDVSEMQAKGDEPHMCGQDPADERSFVIIGGGPCGIAAAQQLRQEGFAGHITLITKEANLPYDRVKLSKAIGESADKLLLRPREWYEKHSIRLFVGVAVTAVDAQAKRITVQDGSTIQYDQLLCATGGAPRDFKGMIPGAELGNIYPLRNIEDSDGVAATLRVLSETCAKEEREPNVVILGSSFIGMEAAAYLVGSKRMKNVTVVGMEKEPFEISLGPAIGAGFRELHENKGVVFRTRSVISSFKPNPANPACVGSAVVKNLETQEETEIAADMVIIGAGIMPSSEYLKDTAGIERARDNSVIVNEYLKAVDGIYVAGDLARFSYSQGGKVEQVRIEHYDVAMDLGRVAARNMLGKNAAYTAVPFFWTAQYGKMLRYAGHGSGRGEVIVHGDMAKGFVAYFLEGDTVTAVASLNRDPVAVAAQSLMRLGRMPAASVVREAESLDLVQLLADVDMPTNAGQ